MYEVARYARTNLSGIALLYDLLAKKPDHKVEGVCKTYDTHTILLNTPKNSFECVSM